MTQHTQVLRPNPALKVVCVLIYLCALLLLTAHLPFGIPERYRVWTVTAFAAAGLFWLAHVFTTRIVLRRDSIRIVSLSSLQWQTIRRTQIDTVSWAKGCRPSLRLRDGTVIGLPNMGRTSQGLTNIIRAWLKRAEVTT